MHPAYSIIFFTTAAGAGYGLLFLLGMFSATGLLPVDRWFGLAGFILSLGLVTAGLLSSTFHLGHPERAWRALSQWRTSWLSREGVAAIVTYVPAGLFAIGWVFLEDTGGMFAVMALLAAIGALITVYTTSMIYGSLQAIPAWSSALVPPVYLVLALMTGAGLLNVLVAIQTPDQKLIAQLAIFTVVVAALLKWLYWREIDGRSADSDVGTATGLNRLGTVRTLDPPHTQENYLQKEMGYRIARKHVGKLRQLTVVVAFLIPLLDLIGQIYVDGPLAVGLAIMALLAMALGVLMERWLFFAEAKHKVMLYYGADAV